MNEKKLTIEVDGKIIKLRLYRREFVEVESVKGMLFIDTGKVQRIKADDLPVGLTETTELQALYRRARGLGFLQETVRRLEGFHVGLATFSPAQVTVTLHIALSQEADQLDRYPPDTWTVVQMP